MREWLDDLLGAFPDFGFRIEDVRELGDRILTRARVCGADALAADGLRD